MFCKKYDFSQFFYLHYLQKCFFSLLLKGFAQFFFQVSERSLAAGFIYVIENTLKIAIL